MQCRERRICAKQLSSAAEASEHEHVCDGCMGSITDVRFKCVCCSNFDLCRKCCARDPPFVTETHTIDHKDKFIAMGMEDAPDDPDAVMPDITLEDELRILEGIEIFNMDWANIARFVGRGFTSRHLQQQYFEGLGASAKPKTIDGEMGIAEQREATNTDYVPSTLPR